MPGANLFDGARFDYSMSQSFGLTAVEAIAADPSRVSVAVIGSEAGSLLVRVGGPPAAGQPDTFECGPGVAWEPFEAPRESIWIAAKAGVVPATVLTRNRSGIHPNLNKTFDALMGRFTAAVDANWQKPIYELLRGLMGLNRWKGFVHFSRTNMPSEADALIDWAADRTATVVRPGGAGDVVFTPKSDFQGNGTSGYINLGFVPQDLLVPQDSMILVTAVDQTNQNNRFLIGNSDASNAGMDLNPHDGGSGTTLRSKVANSGGNAVSTPFVGTGRHFWACRRSMDFYRIGRDNKFLATVTALASTIGSPFALYALCHNSDAGPTQFSTQKYGGALVGAGGEDASNQAIVTLLQEWDAAVAALEV